MIEVPTEKLRRAREEIRATKDGPYGAYTTVLTGDEIEVILSELIEIREKGGDDAGNDS
jgi:hypothetical protein